MTITRKHAVIISGFYKMSKYLLYAKICNDNGIPTVVIPLGKRIYVKRVGDNFYKTDSFSQSVAKGVLKDLAEEIVNESMAEEETAQ